MYRRPRATRRSIMRAVKPRLTSCCRVTLPCWPSARPAIAWSMDVDDRSGGFLPTPSIAASGDFSPPHARLRSMIFSEGLLDGRVAVVSGGGSGIGRATALELARLGATVAVCGRRLEPLQETVAMAPEGIEAVKCDIREADHVAARVEGGLGRRGPSDGRAQNP